MTRLKVQGLYTHKRYKCLDPHPFFGEFYETEFKLLLKHGYLIEGSAWIDTKTGTKYRIKGSQASLGLSDDKVHPQKKEIIE